jgi:hypothetical protein
MHKQHSDFDLLNTNTNNIINNCSQKSNDEYIIQQNKFQKNKTYYTISEKILSILLHLFVMAFFEIYFYFNYIIIIERQMFLEKINTYFNSLSNYYVNNIHNTEKIILRNIFNSYYSIEPLLKHNYEISKKNQIQLYNKLYNESLFMLGIIFCFLFVAAINCLLIRKNVNWKLILIENIVMFSLLCIFEYLFFINIIMNYSPITNNEIFYIICNHISNIINT